MSTTTSRARAAAQLTELRSPRVVAAVANVYDKVAKILGQLAWHAHDDEDEMFYFLEVSLRIELEDNPVLLNQGDAFVVPKGVRHNPVAYEACHLMLIERKSTRHTGRELTAKTRSLAEQLRPISP